MLTKQRLLVTQAIKRTFSVFIFTKTLFAKKLSVFQTKIFVADGAVVLCLPVLILKILPTLSFATFGRLNLDKCKFVSSTNVSLKVILPLKKEREQFSTGFC